MTASRRAILKGSSLTAAMLVSGTSIAKDVTAREPDAELLALRPEWQTSVKAFNAALDMLSEVEERAFALYPAWPNRDDFGYGDGAYERYVAAHEKADTARALIDLEHAVPKAKQLEDEKSDANREIVNQIVELPAHTLEGLRFKVEVSIDEGHNHPELIESIMDDVVALADGVAERLGTRS